MRILLLADINSSHTEKWAKGLAAKGHEIGIFSLNHYHGKIYDDNSEISLLHYRKSNLNNASLLTKLLYILQVFKLKRIIKQFKPQLVHAHYATSYGLIGVLSGFKPIIISVWGSDVYDFPVKSSVNKWLLKKILNKAVHICSTSNCMKGVTQSYTSKEITVIPFGVNTMDYKAIAPSYLIHKTITIGNIKSLERKYGIDVLIKAFHRVSTKVEGKKVRLLIVGDGSLRSEYEKLVNELGIRDSVVFTGRVAHEKVRDYLQLIDIFVSLSVLNSESFGVSLVEAMAAGKPIVASDADGFVEVLGSNDCGLIVQKYAIEEAAEAILKLISNPDLARTMGINAQMRAKKLYEWNDNLELMINVYNEVL